VIPGGPPEPRAVNPHNDHAWYCLECYAAQPDASAEGALRAAEDHITTTGHDVIVTEYRQATLTIRGRLGTSLEDEDDQEDDLAAALGIRPGPDPTPTRSAYLQGFTIGVIAASIVCTIGLLLA
jgi:hypothetical protein